MNAGKKQDYVFLKINVRCIYIFAGKQC